MIDLPANVRRKHVYIPGKTQYGKSTIMFSMAMQDIQNGNGLAVLDPKSDLVEKLMQHIPDHRRDDVIYIDGLTPTPIDFMSWETPEEKDLLASDIISTFKQTSQNVSGDRWPSILEWTLRALLEARDCSFLDIYYFLVSDGRRRDILKKVHDEDTLQYWNEQYGKLPKDSANAITTRMSKFLSPAIKSILRNSPNPLNISWLMENEKILLVNLMKCGKESGNLLGTLLVSKFQQGAMKRGGQVPEDRIPFYLYADEFQNFQTSAFDVILSEAGGLRLCLILANQFVDQLDSKIRSSVFGCTSTYFIFRLSNENARLFKGEIRHTKQGQRGTGWGGVSLYREIDVPFDVKQLTQLKEGQVLYVAANGTAKLTQLKRPSFPTYERNAEYIKNRTKEFCGSPSLPKHDDVLKSKDDGNRAPTAQATDDDPGPTLQSDDTKPRHP